MDADQAKTLSQNFPDVLLAILKRMSPAERCKVLADFENSDPKIFKEWHKADVQIYLKSFGA